MFPSIPPCSDVKRIDTAAWNEKKNSFNMLARPKLLFKCVALCCLASCCTTIWYTIKIYVCNIMTAHFPPLFAAITFLSWTSSLKHWTMKPLNRRKRTNWQAFWVRKPLSSVLVGGDNVQCVADAAGFFWSACFVVFCFFLYEVTVRHRTVSLI